MEEEINLTKNYLPFKRASNSSFLLRYVVYFVSYKNFLFFCIFYFIIKTQNGIRGFFAYALSDSKCTLLDKLPTSIIFILRERGVDVVEITIKNLFMSSAQILNHQKAKNTEYAERSNNISERCINLLKELDTKLVTKEINKMLSKIDNMGNSFNNQVKYTLEQKDFIREKVNEIAK